MTKHRRKVGICPNCQTILHAEANYCPTCGQENHDLKVPVGHLVYETVESITHFDTKLFTSLKTIITRPGGITKDFWAGKRVSHIHPVRLYIFISFVFFLLLTALIDKNSKKADINGDFIEIVELSQMLSQKEIDSLSLAEVKDVTFTIPLNTTDTKPYFSAAKKYSKAQIDSVFTKQFIDKTPENYAAFNRVVNYLLQKEKIVIAGQMSLFGANLKADSREELEKLKNSLSVADDKQLTQILKESNVPNNWFNRNMARRLGTIDINNPLYRKAMSHAVIKGISVSMFILMPLVAFLLWLVFDRKKYFYEHLIFSIHSHSISFIVFSIAILIGNFLPANIQPYIFLILFLGLFAYFMVSLKVLYQNSWPKNIFKSFLVGIVYFFVLMTCTVVSFIYGFLGT